MRANLHRDERRIDTRNRLKRARRDRHHDPGVGEHLDRDRRHACAGGGGPAFRNLFLDHEREAPRAGRPIEELAQQCAGEVVGNVAGDDLATPRKGRGEVVAQDVGLHRLDLRLAPGHLAQGRHQGAVELDGDQAPAAFGQRDREGTGFGLGSAQNVAKAIGTRITVEQTSTAGPDETLWTEFGVVLQLV